jgi:hypothetical protein
MCDQDCDFISWYYRQPIKTAVQQQSINLQYAVAFTEEDINLNTFNNFGVINSSWQQSIYAATERITSTSPKIGKTFLKTNLFSNDTNSQYKGRYDYTHNVTIDEINYIIHIAGVMTQDVIPNTSNNTKLSLQFTEFLSQQVIGVTIQYPYGSIYTSTNATVSSYKGNDYIVYNFSISDLKYTPPVPANIINNFRPILSYSGRFYNYIPPKVYPISPNYLATASDVVPYLITNSTNAYLYCTASSDPVYANTWFGTSTTQTAYLNGASGSYWVYVLFQNYSPDGNPTTPPDYATNPSYGNVTFFIGLTPDNYPYFAQQTAQNYLYDLGFNSDNAANYNQYSFNWSNNINNDNYTGASTAANSSSYSTQTSNTSALYASSVGLVCLNAEYQYFPVGSDTTFSLTIPSGAYWGSAAGYSYFLTDVDYPTDTTNQYIWLPEIPARSNYSVIIDSSNQQVINQVAAYQNGQCWTRAYAALVQSATVIQNATINASYGLGATYGTWSIDFQSGDNLYALCESYYLTERNYLSSESTSFYTDGQPPYNLLEIDGIETLWQNNAPNYLKDSCLQGGCFVSGSYTGGFVVPVGGTTTYYGIWVQCILQVIEASADTGYQANIIFSYNILNDDGSVASAITLTNGKTYWSLLEENPTFCQKLTAYFNSKTVRLYPFISTWTPSGTAIPVGYNPTTKYKNFTYSSP